MKPFLCFLFIVCNTLYLSAQVFDVETIKISGNDDKRINLVIMGDGYTTSQLDEFISDATNFSNTLFSQSPFKEYSNYFNVHAIKVPSNESGADHPGTGNAVDESNWPIPTMSVDTYFNSTFDSYGNHFYLFYETDGNYANNTEAKIFSVLADNFPTYDQSLILVNSGYYGGSGGIFPMASTGISSSEIAIHELGHSLFDLKDEYYPGDNLAGEAINMTQETNPTLIKWKNWIGTEDIGIYPYANSGTASTWNRPHQNCKMQNLGAHFCAVCKEGIIEKIHSLVSPIDGYTPNNTTVENPDFPLDFQLDLIKPDPNTLGSEWILNAVSFASNVDIISIIENNLVEGVNTLTTVVHDNTSSLLVDNHDSFHVYTVTWDINYSSLGIDDIESEINTYNISLYPNPANSVLNLKFESSTTSNLKVEIMSMDGKHIKSSTLVNYENKEVDISDLNQGIYLTNFYSGNILIASKRLVKK